MRQGGEPQGVQVVRQGEPTPYHCHFNPLYLAVYQKCGMYPSAASGIGQTFVKHDVDAAMLLSDFRFRHP